jgi:sporulation protein YlmC with PRC-barrel domain
LVADGTVVARPTPVAAWATRGLECTRLQVLWIRSKPVYVTDLRGLRIISLVSALKMGTVEDALLDPSCRYIAALCVRAYGPGKRRYVLRQSIQRIGRHAVILGGTDDMPGEFSLDTADRLINLRTLIGLVVVSDQGNLVGRIRNAIFNTSTLVIATYEVSQAGLGSRLAARRPLRVDVSEVLSCSKDVLIIPEPIVSANKAPYDASSSVRWHPPEVSEGRDAAGAAIN